MGAAFLAAPFYWWILYLWLDMTPGRGDTDWNRILLVGLIYPMLEEIVFRGAIQGWMRKRRWGSQGIRGVTVANVATSAIFALSHIARRPDWWSAGVFVPGLIFGYFRDRYGNVHASIALHVFYNLGLVLLY